MWRQHCHPHPLFHTHATCFACPHPAPSSAPLQLQATPIDTRGFQSLLSLVDNTANDSFDLYYGLFMYNANSTQQLERLEKAFDEVKARLLHQVGAGAGGWGRGGGQLWGLHPGGEMGVSNQPASSSSNRSPSCFTVAPTHPPNHLLSPPAAARQSAGAALQWGDLRLAAAAAPAAAAPCAARPHQRQQQRHLWQQQQQRLGSSVLRECFGSRLRLLPIVFGSWHTAACPIL